MVYGRKEKSFGSWLKKAGHSIAHAAEKTGKALEHGVEDTGKAIGKTVKGVGETVIGTGVAVTTGKTNLLKSGLKDTGKGALHTVSGAVDTVVNTGVTAGQGAVGEAVRTVGGSKAADAIESDTVNKYANLAANVAMLAVPVIGGEKLIAEGAEGLEGVSKSAETIAKGGKMAEGESAVAKGGKMAEGESAVAKGEAEAEETKMDKGKKLKDKINPKNLKNAVKAGSLLWLYENLKKHGPLILFIIIAIILISLFLRHATRE